MSRSTLFAALAVIAPLACARTQKTQAKQTTAVASKQGATNDDKMQGKIVCTYEDPVGSHIPEKVCFYQEDVDSTRQETQEYLRQNAARQLSHGQ